jgi:large subunit ribosomal protein L18
MAKTNLRHKARIRRKKHIRKTIVGTSARPRLCVFRSAKHIYAQVIDDSNGVTLASASSIGKELKANVASGGNKEGAKVVGAAIAAQATSKGISQVVFDRNGFLYHGRVKALADAAREGGLKF